MIGGLVSAAGGVISLDDARQMADELALQREALEDFASSIPDRSEGPLRDIESLAASRGAGDSGSLDCIGFGKPEEDDLKVIRFLREEFKKKDPTWGGLVPRDDGKFGRIWAHPRSSESLRR